MKVENARLLQSIADFKSKGDMAKETVKNLSSVIRDKDLEIDGLKSRNESLVTLVQESTSKPPSNGKSIKKGQFKKEISYPPKNPYYF